MGESPSARTERELADLRRKIDDDVDALVERAKSDVDPRNLLRRQPVATVGTLGAMAARAGRTPRSSGSPSGSAAGSTG